MIDLSQVRRYYVACGYTDLRRGIDGLAAIVTQQFGAQLNEESLFLFCGRRTDRIKALYWSGDGYLLLSRPSCGCWIRRPFGGLWRGYPWSSGQLFGRSRPRIYFEYRNIFLYFSEDL